MSCTKLFIQSMQAPVAVPTLTAELIKEKEKEKLGAKAYALQGMLTYYYVFTNVHVLAIVAANCIVQQCIGPCLTVAQCCCCKQCLC
jgi:hypothetical protein